MTEHNICGVLVMTNPETIAMVEGNLNAINGVEVHASSPEGKLVVTVEDTPDESCINRVGSLNTVDGVVSTALVYQHSESEEAEQEL